MEINVYTKHFIDRMDKAKLELDLVKLEASRKVKWWMSPFNIVRRVIDGCDWRKEILDANIAMAKEHLDNTITLNQFEFETAYTDYTYKYFEERYR